MESNSQSSVPSAAEPSHRQNHHCYPKMLRMYDTRCVQGAAKASKMKLKVTAEKVKRKVSQSIKKCVQGTTVVAHRSKAGAVRIASKCFSRVPTASQEDMQTVQGASEASTARATDIAENVNLSVEDSFSDLTVDEEACYDASMFQSNMGSDQSTDKTATAIVIDDDIFDSNVGGSSASSLKNADIFRGQEHQPPNMETSSTNESKDKEENNDRGSLPLPSTGVTGTLPISAEEAVFDEDIKSKEGLSVHGGQLELAKGDRIGEFEVLDELGRGHFSTVCKVFNTKTSATFAAKIMPITLEQDENRRGYDFHEEAMIHASLKNIHVVAFRGLEVRDGHGLLLMDFIDGPTLHTYVSDEEYLEEDEARDLFKQLASTVQFCHKAGVFHRDLKLENILVTRWKSIRLCDFGLAALDVNGGRVFGSSGTRQYSAPEVLLHGEDGYDGAKADVFSLGVVLFAMTHGWMPFGRERGEDGMISADGEVPFADEITDDLRQLLLRMLSASPVERASLEEILGHPWYVSE